MGRKYHIDGTQEFGYSTINRCLYSFYLYMNTVKRVCKICNNYAPVDYIPGYVAHFSYIRLKSFDTLMKVVVEHKDYVSANCLLRMLGDCVAVFRLVYMEPDENLRILRHCLYVLDGCERNLDVLPEENINKGSIPDDELEDANKDIKFNRDWRLRMMGQVKEMLDQSPLQKINKAAFDRIVKDRNWKFKEFKEYKKKGSNQYQWRELYSIIDQCKFFDLLSFMSQYAHGLSMSNLNIVLDENNCDGILSETVGLIDRMNEYLMEFFDDANDFIYEGLLEPEMRDKILACFDKKYRPDVRTWEQGVLNKRRESYIRHFNKR